jgi:murein DD-endopeptidase MepM/ murein hydrolase activator NlpD
MGKSWLKRDSGGARKGKSSLFGFRRKGDGSGVETAWRFQLPRPDFVAGSYEGRTFLDPSNHLGEDSAHDHHDAIHAIASGVVRYASTATGYGRVVVVEHRLPDGNLICSIYGHLCGHSGYPLISKGTAVRAGDVLGYIGDVHENGDGREHLHLGLRKGAYDGTFCGYVRRPECTPRHYEEPTPFIEKRSGKIERLGPLLPNPGPPGAALLSLRATVRNGYHYGGAFEFRLRFPGGAEAASETQTQRLAPGNDATLVFSEGLPEAGSEAGAVLEVKPPGVEEWEGV